ncbi:uncharacterized protein LOC122497738 [Leptopilina heterotoma]|uniref:uncharacterized protein LOC122497738 n=1 Tax=Leptopilina heterotoma TaxID=63436 RepID=UPI001CA86D92|nr:uncharacterized protein LOC122497738 [Leptopilina heterotoma]
MDILDLPSIDESDFDVRDTESKNRGVFTKHFIKKGETILEYIGELVTSASQMKERQIVYEEKGLGCYVLDFQYRDKKMFIDATAESNYKGRLINHSNEENIKPFLKVINEIPRVFFKATQDIAPDCELLWNYGEMRRSVLNTNPWLKKAISKKQKGQLIKTPIESQTSVRSEIPSKSETSIQFEALYKSEKHSESADNFEKPNQSEIPIKSETPVNSKKPLQSETSIESQTNVNSVKPIQSKSPLEAEKPIPQMKSKELTHSEISIKTKLPYCNPVIMLEKLPNYPTDVLSKSFSRKRKHKNSKAYQDEIIPKKFSTSLEPYVLLEFDFKEFNDCQQNNPNNNTENNLECIVHELELPVIQLPENIQIQMHTSCNDTPLQGNSTNNDISASISYEVTDANDTDLTDDPDFVPDSSATVSVNISKNASDTSEKCLDNIIVGPPVDIRVVTVPPSKVNGSSSLKKNFCRYCKELTTKLPRHLELKHYTEEDVKVMINLPKNSAERRKVIDKIRKEGNHEHNTNKDYNTGVLLTCRRRQEKYNNNGEDYIHCSMCLGAFSKKTIHIHYKQCDPLHKKGEKEIKVSGRRVEGFIHERASPILRNEIFPVMNDDNIVRIIRYDLLIILMGNRFCEQYTKIQQYDSIRANLRLLGRLKEAALKVNKELTELFLILHSKNYDTFKHAVRSCAGYNEQTGLFASPSVASQLGTLIKKCMKVWIAECIKKGYQERKKSAAEFLELFEEDFPTAVNKKVVENQIKAKRAKKINLPLKQDINALYKHLKENCTKSFNILKQSFDLEAWKLLSECTLILLQLFNRKRAGEVERISIDDFMNRESVDENVHPDLYSHMDSEKQKRSKLFVRINIDGKKGRAVPALLDEELVQFVNCIIDNRKHARV